MLLNHAPSCPNQSDVINPWLELSTVFARPTASDGARMDTVLLSMCLLAFPIDINVGILYF